MIAFCHDAGQHPHDMLNNARSVLRFVAEALAVPPEVPLSDDAHHGLYLILTGVENTMTQAMDPQAGNA